MTKKKVGLLAAVAAVLILCAVVLVFLLKDNSGGDKDVSKTEHTVEIKTSGGMALADISVFVYEDETQSDLVWKADTDEEGKITFKEVPSESYVAVLEGVPEGYELADSYELRQTDTEIVLNPVILDGSSLTGYTYELGSVVRDFSVTAFDGTEYKISELLEEKKAVALNFWFINCGPCRMEFPYLQQAYEEYTDEIEVLALNPVDGTDATVKAFAEDMGLTFPVSACDGEWQNCMMLTAYPTTVIIDRYGTIAMIHKGSITDKETFCTVFEYFTSDDYKQTIVKNISDIEK